MADETVVVCDVLCFLKHKFGSSNVKVLKIALLDFYDVEVLSRAKVRLVNDISELTPTIDYFFSELHSLKFTILLRIFKREVTSVRFLIVAG